MDRTIPIRTALLVLLSLLGASGAAAASADQVQARMAADLRAGRPIVVHVIVALADNRHQGIVPVPATLPYDKHQKCGMRAARKLFIVEGEPQRGRRP